MFKKLSKKRVLMILSSVILPVLLIQAYVMAQPTSSPPGGNIDATFDTLGVGNSNPTELLVVGTDLGDVSSSEQIVVGGTSGAPGVTMGESLDNNGRINYLDANDDLVLYTKYNGLVNPSQLVLDGATGNIGIGAPSPFAQLQIGIPTLNDTAFAAAHPKSLAITGNATDTKPALWMGLDPTHKAEITYDGTNSIFTLENNSTTDHPAQLMLDDNGNIGINAGPSVTSSALEVQAFNPASVSQIILGQYDTNNYGILGRSSIGVLGHGQQYGVRGEYDANNYGNIGTNGTGVSAVGSTYGVRGTYDANNYGILGSNGTGVLGYGQQYGVRGEYDASNYGILGSATTGVRAVGSDYGVKATGATGVDSTGNTYGIMTKADTTSSGTFAMGIYSTVARNFIDGEYYSGFFVDSQPNGPYGDYYGVFADKLTVARTGEAIEGYIATFSNWDSTVAEDGIAINAGTSTQGIAAHMIDFNHYDETTAGSITKLGDTVSYNAFTAGHVTTIPASVDEYEYGTIMSLKETTTPEGSNQPQYYSEPSTNAYDNSIFGVYSGKYSEDDNTHQVFALGDGHVLVTTENGSIKAGDPITTSDLAGLGMKATEAGTILGYALEDWDGSTATRTETLADGTEVKVGLVAVYYYPGTKYTPDQQTKIQSLEERIAKLETALDSLTK